MLQEVTVSGQPAAKQQIVSKAPSELALAAAIEDLPRRRPRWRRWALLIALLLICAAGVYRWWTQPLIVQAATIRRGEAADLVYATGFVEPEHPVSVASRVTAPVTSVLIREGDVVRRGQPLVLLDSGQQRAAVAQAAAERRRLAADETRVLKLFADGWATRALRDQVVSAASGARAAEQGARALLDQLTIRAGIDGIVIKRDVEPGDLAIPTKTLILLGHSDRLKVTATVDERDIVRLRPGQVALMSSDAWPGRVLRGRVREITPAGDPSQRAFRVRIALEDRARLPIGLTLEVNVLTRYAKDALLAPAMAVTSGHAWVLEQGRLRRREVRTGIAGAREVEILAGLRSGDRVVVNPPEGLRDGVRARAAR